MKSGPTLAEATRTPRRRKAASRPVATVVLPTPELVPATTRRGPSRGTPATLTRESGRQDRRRQASNQERTTAPPSQEHSSPQCAALTWPSWPPLLSPPSSLAAPSV